MFREGPGKTTLMVHDVDTRSAHPVRLPPYRLPHAYHEAVHRELKEMASSHRLRVHGVLLLCLSRRKMGL